MADCCPISNIQSLPNPEIFFKTQILSHFEKTLILNVFSEGFVTFIGKRKAVLFCGYFYPTKSFQYKKAPSLP